MPFVKGQVANPNGARRIREGITPHLKDLIDKRHCVFEQVNQYLTKADEQGKLGNITMGRRLACRLLQQADEGNMDALKVVLERVEGKVRDDLAAQLPSINIQTNVLIAQPDDIKRLTD